ncbi:sodium ion-translocating decarboxylase subunit beta [Eubacteriales bacterium OttesenSCG-928-G02]|nr:sodium ion-translocating decarboxylase subunit beta [Eubacteriales bacterium OttesenSCG-928-G02]
MLEILNWIKNIFTENSAFAEFFKEGGWKNLVMLGLVCVLFYLAIVKKFEPLLLLPIAFGMLLANIPKADMFHMEFFIQEGVEESKILWNDILQKGGLLDVLYLGVKLGIYPPLIFLGVGAMTDFSPLIANPKSVLMGAASQFGVFAAFIGAILLGFSVPEAASIGIIGGADGPTAIQVTKELAPKLLGPIAIAAYSYMALVPFIQPPIMKAFTTKKERAIKMDTLRPVSKTEKILFPIVVAIVVCAILPAATPLVGMLMLGNLINVSGVTDRISKTAQNGLMNVLTIVLGISVGATAGAETFLNIQTLYIIALGLAAFAFATLAGVLFGKLMSVITKGKINPLIGSAGVSAVPMAARVSQVVGQKEDPSNFLLMHAMGPNVSGVIGSAVAAGVFLTLFQ